MELMIGVVVVVVVVIVVIVVVVVVVVIVVDRDYENRSIFLSIYVQGFTYIFDEQYQVLVQSILLW